MNRNHADSTGDGARLAEFHHHRKLLFSLAYRMLGSISDSEDILQEAFIRWQGASDQDVRSPKAFLVAIVSRLCINHLQSARARRERSIGHWLPAPLVTETDEEPAHLLEMDESLSMALLILLERLTPTERAVFILREVFGLTYAELAQSIGQSQVNCRQQFRRARQHIGDIRRHFGTSSRAHGDLLDRFIDAARNGNVEGLMALLAGDVTLQVDGGAAAPIANVIQGADAVVRFFKRGARVLPENIIMRRATINGSAGVANYVDGAPVSTLAIEVNDGRIQRIYIVANREKLSHLPTRIDGR